MAVGENALELVFKIRADSRQAQTELIDAQKAVTRIIKETNTEAGKIGAGVDLGGLRSKLLSAFSGLGGSLQGGVGNAVEGLASSLPQASLAAGGFATALAAAGAALVAFTLQQGKAAEQLQLTATTTGLSTTQLQVYGRAAEAAGVNANALTTALAKVKEETGRSNDSINAFLRSLETIQNPVERLAVAQANLGKLSGEASAAILKLTDNQGELRKEIEQSGIVLTEFEVRELARVEQRFDTLAIKAEGLAKRALLSLIDSFTEMGVELGEGAEGLERYRAAQGRVESAARGVTDAISQQSSAVNELKIALDSLNASAIQSAVKKRVDSLVELVSGTAKRALTPKEAAAVFNQQLSLDPLLKQGVELGRIFETNKKLFNELVSPPDRKKAGAAPQDTATRDRLRLLEAGLKEEESIFRLQNESIKRAFDQRLIDEGDYTKRLIEAVEARQRVTLDTLAQERAAVQQSRLKPADRTRELEAIAAREREIRRQSKDDEAKIDFESQQRTDRLAKELVAAQIETERAGLARRRALIEAALDERAVSFEEGEKQLTEIARREMELRFTTAEAEVQNTREHTKEREIANERVNALLEERLAFEEAALRRIGDARKKDIEALRQYEQERAKLIESLNQQQIGGLQAAAERLAQRAIREGSLGLKFGAIGLRQQADEAAAAERNRLNVKQIAAEEEVAKKLALTAAQKEEVERLSNERRLEEERRFQEELRIIREQAEADTDAANPASNANVFGISDASLGLFDAFRSAALQAFGDVAGGALNMRQVLGDVFSGLLQATQATLQSFILTGTGGAAAFKSLAAAIISSLAIQALVKVPFQIAEGVKEQALAAAAAAAGDFRGAALHQTAAGLHFSAAKLYAAIGGGALGAGLAIGAAGGLGGGGGSGAGSEIQRDVERRQPEESRFRSGDVIGRLNDPDRDFTSKLNQSFVGQVLERMRGTQEEIQRGVEEQRAIQAQHLAATEAGLAATETLTSKITSFSPGDVLGRGVEENPHAVAEGTKESLIRDAGFTRTLAENLRLS